MHRDFGFLPIPQHLYWGETREAGLSIPLNLLLAFTSAATAANRDYCTPLLSLLAGEFNVSYDTISLLPTLAGLGIVCGIFMVCPAGDVWRRRPLLLGSVFLTMIFNITQATAQSASAFQAFTFLANMSSIAFQLIVPFSGDLAGPKESGRAVGVSLFGLISGVYFARLISGIIAEYSTWRAVFGLAAGTEALAFVLLYWCLPDFPRKPAVEGHPTSYFGIIRSLFRLTITEPVLGQSWPLGLISNLLTTGFWSTTTFILSGPPFNYDSLKISLVSLAGVTGALTSPFQGLVTDSFLHFTAVLIGAATIVAATIPFLVAGGTHIAAILVTGMLLEVGCQQLHIAAETRIVTINPMNPSRMNCVYGIAAFTGSLIGGRPTAALYLKYGWRNLAIFLFCCAISLVIVQLSRGPHQPQSSWLGWSHGHSLRKPLPTAHDGDKKQEEDPRQRSEVNSAEQSYANSFKSERSGMREV